MIDLSALRSINSTTGNGNERVRFFVDEQGTLKLGNLAAANHAEFFLQHISSRVEVDGSLFLESTSRIEIVEGAQISIVGDLLYRQTDEALAQLDQGIVNLNGSGIQFIEAGSFDEGLAGAGEDNFGIGQLVVGVSGAPTTVVALDLFDNGNRSGPDGELEALYLEGVGGEDGLFINLGSVFVLNNVNVYARINGVIEHLNALFDDEVNSEDVGAIPFGAGFLALETPITGDYDFNGKVDGDDFLSWQRGIGTGDVASDGNRDGVIDGQDLAIWESVQGASSQAAAAVPEPGCLTICLLTILSWVIWANRVRGVFCFHDAPSNLRSYRTPKLLQQMRVGFRVVVSAIT
ncbi:hypothetical protein OAS39_01925 [Pirellulales bacterium]|nr:hypothetical protein [Pirellulales bacterium]